MTPTPARLGHAERALSELLKFSRPADQALSAYFRSHRNLGQQDRAFIAETAFAVLRRKRSLEAAAGSAAPRDLAIAALVRVFGLSGRALGPATRTLARPRQGLCRPRTCRPRCRPTCPTGCGSVSWPRTAAQEAAAIAQALLNPAPLDLRVNLAKLRARRSAERSSRSKARRRRIRPPASG